MASDQPVKTERDWTYQVTDRIESVVGAVKSKTTAPATMVARIVVFGVVIGVLATALLFLLVVAGIRVLDVYLPFHPIGRRVWVVDAAASAIFLGLGTFFWRRRHPKSA